MSTPAVDEDAPGPPISVPDSSDTSEGSKLKMIVQLVKKSLGVKDIAAMRLSLPASLLEPVPNLEYWQYLDRPDFFAAINDSDDPFQRMLAVVRWALTKDLKFVHGKVCKPYNSVLGEHFRAHWDVPPVSYPDDPDYPPIPTTHTTSSASGTPSVKLTTVGILGGGDTASVKSGRSSKSIARTSLSGGSNLQRSPSTAATSPQQQAEGSEALASEMSSLSLGNQSTDSVRIVYLTEQISHHPPISAYHAACPSKHLSLSGIDQISARVSGTTLRVAPGGSNKGMFVKIHRVNGSSPDDKEEHSEEYQITHPVASVNGILRAAFYVTVGDSCIITCSYTGKGTHGPKYRTILEYKEESWLGKPHFLIEGVIHTIDSAHPGDCDEWTKVKHVPKNRVVAQLEGCWKGYMRWRRTEQFYLQDAITSSVASSPNPSHVKLAAPPSTLHAASKSSLIPGGQALGGSGSATDDGWAPLLDLNTMLVIPKKVRPISKQVPYESRKLWEAVTTRLLKKEFGDATKEKLAIEQKQRDLASERKRIGTEFIPKFFHKNIESGVPKLTEEGVKAIEEELAEKEGEESVQASS